MLTPQEQEAIYERVAIDEGRRSPSRSERRFARNYKKALEEAGGVSGAGPYSKRKKTGLEWLRSPGQVAKRNRQGKANVEFGSGAGMTAGETTVEYGEPKDNDAINAEMDAFAAKNKMPGKDGRYADAGVQAEYEALRARGGVNGFVRRSKLVAPTTAVAQSTAPAAAPAGGDTAQYGAKPATAPTAVAATPAASASPAAAPTPAPVPAAPVATAAVPASAAKTTAVAQRSASAPASPRVGGFVFPSSSVKEMQLPGAMNFNPTVAPPVTSSNPTSAVAAGDAIPPLGPPTEPKQIPMGNNLEETPPAPAIQNPSMFNAGPAPTTVSSQQVSPQDPAMMVGDSTGELSAAQGQVSTVIKRPWKSAATQKVESYLASRKAQPKTTVAQKRPARTDTVGGVTRTEGADGKWKDELGVQYRKPIDVATKDWQASGYKGSPLALRKQLQEADARFAPKPALVPWRPPGSRRFTPLS